MNSATFDPARTILKKTNMKELPKEDGFYWWREVSNEQWRMVHVADLAWGLNNLMPAMLAAWDVEFCTFKGRSLKNWNSPVGEWVKAQRPGAVL